MKNFTSKAVLAVLLSFTVLVAGCSVSQFEAVLNEIGPAVSTVIQIIAISKGTPADLTPVVKIATDVKTLETLYSDYQSVSAATQPTVAGHINSAFTVLNGDLASIFSATQVSDPQTQAKITALVALIQTGVNIAEAAVPSANAKLQLKGSHLTASDLADSFDKVLTAKTGHPEIDNFTSKHQIHEHGKFLRTITVGVVK